MTTAIETSRLADLEETIGRGLETFVEVGEALREIRDSGLYKDGYPTFEEYCRQRWQMSRPRAYELMQSSEVVSAIADTGAEPPANEAQARPLAPLRERPEEMTEAWMEASADGEPTAAKVKEAVSRRMDVHYSSQTDEWATPQDLFDTLDAEFKFELDVCALDSSAKCPTYFTPETDGLNQDWKNFRCWMNPPYGEAIGEWMAKAADAASKGATVVCLVPARVDTGWWWDYCLFGEIRFLRGRLKFGGSTTSAPFPSALVIFGSGFTPKVRWWTR